MRKRISSSEKLDKIGIKLIETASLREAELDKIISKPLLFDSIAAEIKKEKNRRQRKSSFVKLFDASRLNWQKIGLSSGIIGILAISFTGLFIYYQKDSAMILISENENSFKNVEFLDPSENQKNQPASFEKTSQSQILKVATNNRRISAKKEHKQSANSKQKITPPRKQIKAIDEEVFYPLMFAGNFNDGDSRHIIRVELTRDALAGLGINFPLEDENERIETDLLVGSDGQPQAYRFANNF